MYLLMESFLEEVSAFCCVCISLGISSSSSSSSVIEDCVLRKDAKVREESRTYFVVYTQQAVT